MVAICASLAQAEMIDADKASQVAEGFLSKSSVAKTILAERSVDSVEAYGSLWIARLAPSGYIEIAGSTKCAPILSFSATDFAEPEVGSPFAAKLTGDSMMVEAKEADESAADNADWAKYTAPATKKRALLKSAPASADQSTVVGPLLGATWHQGAPYSDFTPLSGPCGCAATAGGQEHRYWRWPYRFEGSREIDHSIQMANGAWYTHTIRANGLVPFDWDKICSIYSGAPSIPDATDKAASYNAAYLTLWMQSLTAQVFKRGSSGATQKLRNYADQFWFERDATEANYWRDGYTNLWLAIKKDLDWGSPIQVNSPVHVMVVDGYAIENEGEADEIDYINLNYGWGGAEGWVNLKTAVTEGTSGGRLADFQTGYRPQKRVQFEPVPKVCASDVTLTWHIAPCYTNRTTGFTIEIAKAGGATTSDTINTHEETTTYTATGLDIGGAYTFTVTPIMKEGEGEGRSNVAVTTIGTPQPAPEITGVSSIAGGLEHSYQGIFVECARGSLNKIDLTCSTSVTSLKAYSSHLTVLPDEKVTTANNGNGSWTINVDATAMDSTWDGDMVLLTLVAANSDGTEAYRNLVLRFNSMRQAPSGTLTLVETNPTAPVWFGGTTTLDANGQSVTFGASALNGNGTVTLQNGTFTFEGLGGFTGTLKWAPSVTVNLPADMSNFAGTLWLESYGGSYMLSRNLPSTAKVYVGGNTYLKPDNVTVDAAVSGNGLIYINTGKSSFSNITKDFTGTIIVATELTLKAGQEKNVTVESGTLYLTLDKAQVAYGYETSFITENWDTVVFQDEDGNQLAKWTASFFNPDQNKTYSIAATANTWTPDSETGTGNFWDAARWSQGLPSEGDYVIFNDNFGDTEMTEMTLNLSSDLHLGYVKVKGTKFNIKAADGTAKLTVDTLENEIPTKLATTQIDPTVVIPKGKLFIQQGFTISCDIDSSLAKNLRDITDTFSAVSYGNEYGDTYCVWRGTVVFSDYDASSGLDILDWGHANSFVRLNGVTGYLTTLQNEVIDIPIELKDNGSSPAFVWSNGSNKLTTINKIKGSGVMQTTGGGSERVLLKDVTDFTGQFWLAAKTVAIADEMPTENTGNNGKLHVCKAATIAPNSIWNIGGGAYFGSGCDLDVYGQLWSLTQPMTTYGEGATITLEDGGVIRACTALAGSYSPTLNFKAGKYQFEDAINETKTVNFCADEGKYTTLDANGKSIILGSDFFSGPGDVYLTSSSSGGSFTIQGIPAAYTGTIYVDSTVGLALPDDLSSMGGKINISEITLARASSGIGNIEVSFSATLQVTLTDDEAMEGLTVTGVTLNGGTIEFVDQRGTIVGSSTDSLVYVKPEDYTVPSPEPTVIWYNDFSATNDGYTLTDWQQTHGENSSSVTIDQDNNGLFVDFASAKGYFTVLVKYSNLSASENNKRVLFATTANSDYTRNRCGIRLLTDSKVQGLWNSSTTANSDANYGSASTGTVPSSGTLAFVYDKTSGTNVGGLTAYVAGVDETLPTTALWSNTALKAGDAYGFAVGGNCRDGSASGVEAANGMTITGLAIFDRVLTTSELKYFRWPEEGPGDDPEPDPEPTLTVTPESGAVTAGTKMTVTCSDPTATIWYQQYGETEWTEYTEPVALATGLNQYCVKVNTQEWDGRIYQYYVTAPVDPEPEPEPEYEGPDPVAVWVAGEFDDDKSAHGGLEFALNDNTIDGNGNIVIGNSATLGATAKLPDATYQKVTMLVQYSLPSGGAPAANSVPASLFSTYDLGARAAQAASSTLDGYWLNGSTVTTGYAFSNPAPTIPLEGYILISTYANKDGAHGTAVYTGENIATLVGGEKSGLRFTGDDHFITSVGIGGPTVAGAVPWAGMVIKSVALFDSWLTPDDIEGYKFPEQGAVQPEDSDRYVVEPVASWVNDFKTTEKNGCTLSVSGTTAVKDDAFGGVLTVGDSAVVIDTASADALTVLVKYRSAPAIQSAPVVTFGGQAAVTFDSGICTDTSVDRQLAAYYSFVYGSRMRGIYAVEGNPTLSSDGGYLVCARKTDAYLAYVGDSLNNMTGGVCTTGMQISNSTLRKIGIGGQTELSNNDANMVPFTGFVVEKVVVFNGYYTPDQIRYVENPEDGDTVTIADNATWRFAATATPREYMNIGTLSSSGTIAITNAAELTEGTYPLATWTTAQKKSTGYGHVGTLDTTGLPAGLSAELVYGARAIYLRVWNPTTQAEKGTLKVWPYGDSITEGFNAGGTRANYRVLLAQKLSMLGFNVEMVGCYDKINNAEGIDPSGQTIPDAWKWHSAKHGATAGPTTSAAGRANLCENVDTLCAQAGNPDVVLLLAGANDIVPGTGRSAQQVVSSITNIVAHIAMNLPDSKIVVGTQINVEQGYNSGNYNHVVSMIPQVNALLKTYADNLPEELVGKVFLADLNSYVKSGEYGILFDHGSDHLHPDWWGHDQMAEGWLSVITNQFTSTQAFQSANIPAAPTSEELGAAAKSELADYIDGFKLARRIDAANNLDTANPYAYSGDGATENIEKVGYFVEYVRSDNNAHRWVWVDMDAFGTTLADVGLPAVTHQQVVTSLHVKSNHNGIEDVAADDDTVTGFVEFSPYDYIGNVSGVSGAPTGNASCYDWNDKFTEVKNVNSGTNACMQVHRISPSTGRGGQVLFAYNNWQSSSLTAEFGIGNFSQHFFGGGEQTFDYTKTTGLEKMNADAYSVKRIEIWTKAAEEASVVAQIGGDTFTSLAEAVQAVSGNEPVEISLLLESNENVNLPSNVTVTESEANLYAGTLSGSGTLVLAGTRSSAMQFGEWAGTVVLPTNQSFGGAKFDDYGIAGSVVRLQGANTGWFNYNAANNTQSRAPVETTVEIPAGASLMVTGWSASYANAFNVIKGEGTFGVNCSAAVPLNSTDYSAYFHLRNVAQFTGSLVASEGNVGIAVGSTRPYQLAVADGGKILLTSADATLAATASPTPETTVANSYVKQVEGVYSVETYKTITFKNEDGTTLYTITNAKLGDTPVYGGETPTKDATEQYTYTFIGWNPAIATVTGDATYTAQFSETEHKSTEYTDFPVPYSWLEEYIPAISGQSDAMYETIAKSEGANGRSYWESYVLGLDPTNETSTFTATIRLDGTTPIVEYSPTNETLRASGAIEYILQGKPSLLLDWQDVTFDDPGDTNRFFRVRVNW